MKTHIKGIAIITLALAFAGAARCEESVAGKWKGQFDSQIGLQKYTYEFRVDGDKLTGKATGEREMGTNEVVITEGKISTNEIFFVEPLTFGDQEIRIEYKGKFTSDEIKFHRKVGDVAEEDFVAKRLKESGDADTNSTNVSQYPKDPSLLPGKRPAQTWSDFPKFGRSAMPSGSKAAARRLARWCSSEIPSPKAGTPSRKIFRISRWPIAVLAATRRVVCCIA
jgi:hypothetical protein